MNRRSFIGGLVAAILAPATKSLPRPSSDMAKLLAANSFYGKFGKTVGRTAREFIGVDFGYWNAARSAVVTMNGHRIGRIVDVEFEVVEPPRFPFPRRCVVVPLRGSGEEPKT